MLFMNKCSYSVLRNAEIGDCTNHGLSSRVNSAIMFFNCSQNEAIAYCNEHNINPLDQFILVERMLWGEDHSYAEPLIKPKGIQVNGGNFLYTSNGNSFKFKGYSTTRPIPIHDRFETQEEYNALTR